MKGSSEGKMPAKKTIKLVVILLAAALLIFWMGSLVSRKSGVQELAKKAGEQGETGQKQRKIKYWRAPMDPAYIRNKPGKSPMGMDLIPVYEDEEEGADRNVIKIDPTTVQNLGVRTARVSRGPLTAVIRTVGRVTYDEERIEHIHTKVSGWVENLYVNTTGEPVRKGQKLLSIYSPDLVATQEEYLQALQYKKETSESQFSDVKSGADTLIEATRRRLLFMDIDPAQIDSLERSGKVQKTMALRSPSSGIVIDKKVLEGMMVTPGTELYTVANISTVWVMGSVYEYELPFIRKGQEANITLPYYPGITYRGKISFIYPYLSPDTRTVQVRMVFENPGLRLKPDMYADVMIKSKVTEKALLVPSEAVIRTGTRSIVIKALGEGKFLPKEVVLGPEGQGVVQVKSGLSEGDMVVTSGQFLIDSESNLREAVNKMIEAQRPAEAPNQGKPVVPAAQTAGSAPSGENAQKMEPSLNKDQKALMMKMTDVYVQMQKALVAESLAGVRAQARIMEDLVGRLKTSGQGETLQAITRPAEKSLDGLLNGDIEKARDSFVLLSRTMVNYIKGAGRNEGLSSGIRIFFCPMKKEPWLQKDKKVENPYLGKSMLSCGNEVKY
jgi:RND family efflux transporter MFP subunit